MSLYLNKNPISGLDILVSPDDAAILPVLGIRKLSQEQYRDIKENKTKIIKKEFSKYFIRKWNP